MCSIGIYCCSRRRKLSGETENYKVTASNCSLGTQPIVLLASLLGELDQLNQKLISISYSFDEKIVQEDHISCNGGYKEQIPAMF